MDCCVCYNKSKQITDCNHLLCIKCFNKLKQKNCPLCRTRNIALYDQQKNSNNCLPVMIDNKHYKLIKMTNLKRFIFSKTFKSVLETVTRQLKFNKYLGIHFVIDNQVFMIDEIIPYNLFIRCVKIDELFDSFQSSNILFKLKCNIPLNDENFFALKNVYHHRSNILKNTTDEIEHLKKLIIFIGGGSYYNSLIDIFGI